MRIKTLLILAVTVFLLERSGPVLWGGGWWWLFPLLMLYYLITAADLAQALVIIIPIALLFDGFSGYPFGMLTLAILLVGLIIFLGRKVLYFHQLPDFSHDKIFS